MGLDMYLKKNMYPYVSIDDQHRYTAEVVYKDTETGDIKGVFPTELNSAFVLGEMYWRKANAIHQWFVKHVQDGEDDCQEYEVAEADLEQLKRACREILALKHGGADDLAEAMAKRNLPTQAGFFYGDTAYDDYYYDMLQETIVGINRLLSIETPKQDPNIDTFTSYTYRSSW